jgi:polyhydroxybutyrate depolymerase
MKSRILIISLIISVNLFSQTSKTMQFDGLTRKYIEYVPSTYNGTEAVPVVLCLHGLGDNMNNFYNIGMNYLADIDNFIVLTPEAIADPNYGTAWNSGASYMGIVLNQTVDDVGFLSALIDCTVALYNVDESNIFVTGFSMGGFMTNRLACELTSKFKAVASVAGTIGNSLTCSPSQTIPFCHFHGTADGTVAYTNNNYGNDAEELVNYWITNNNCTTTPIIDSISNTASDGINIVHYKYTNQNNNAEVEFYKAINADHQWLYEPVNDMTYTIKIWDFFKKHLTDTVTSVSSINEQINSINIYPNPAKTYVNINSNEIVLKYSLLDVYGRCLGNMNVNSKNFRINLNNLPKGVYILELASKNSQQRNKIIVE